MRLLIFTCCLLLTTPLAHADPGTISALMAFIATVAPYVPYVTMALTPYGMRSRRRGAQPSTEPAEQAERTAPTPAEETACRF